MSLDWLRAEARNEYSQFGEDGVVDAIFKVIAAENRWCFECGASDGFFFSNTRRLIRQGWTGVLVEQDQATFRRLMQGYEGSGYRPHLLCDRIEELDPILAHFGAPLDIDLAVIDVDGQDFYLFNSLLIYRPRVVIVEFDPIADPEFIPERGGAGQAGAAAMARLAAGKLYAEVFRSWCNLVLVRQPTHRLLLRATAAA